MHSDEKTQIITGQVRWYSKNRGYGFAVSDAGGPDILIHANVLADFGRSSVANGAHLELRFQHTDNGMKAVEIISIIPSNVFSESSFPDFDVSEIPSTPLQPGRVKWFDKSKGYGFANVFGSTDDVFLHIEILQRSGLSDLQPGEALSMRIVDREHGRMASEVLDWEAATKHEDLSDLPSWE
jgi:CspA family cold shock protein